MPDNVTVDGVNYSADDVTTSNGSTVAAGSTITQRIKVQYGDDSVARDVSPAYPLPSINPDGTITGTITATDAVLGTHAGTGVPLTGTPTSSSYVAYAVRGGESGFTLRLSGTFGGGTVWVESSVDSTNGVDGGWVTNLVRQSGVDVTTLDTSITAAGVFRGVIAGYSYLRVRVTGATTPSIGVAIRASAGPSVTAQVASLPPGANNIGMIDVAGQNFSVATGNSSTTPLGASATFTGTTQNSLRFATFSVSVYANVAGTLYIEESQDGTNWDISYPFTVTAASAYATTVGLTQQYVRVRYVNGATLQTTFRLQSVLNPIDPVLPRNLSQSGALRVAVDSRAVRVAVATSGRFTVGAAADTAPAGRLWLLNPVGSTTTIALRRVEFSSAPTAATAFISSPRVLVERITFTGTASGATVTPSVRDTTEAALVGTLRSANTGITPTTIAAAYAFVVVPILTAVGASVPTLQEWEPDPDGRLILRAGQGVVIRQADAGTTSDTRVFQVNVAWEEF